MDFSTKNVFPKNGRAQSSCECKMEKTPQFLYLALQKSAQARYRV